MGEKVKVGLKKPRYELKKIEFINVNQTGGDETGEKKYIKTVFPPRLLWNFKWILSKTFRAFRISGGESPMKIRKTSELQCCLGQDKTAVDYIAAYIEHSALCDRREKCLFEKRFVVFSRQSYKTMFFEPQKTSCQNFHGGNQKKNTKSNEQEKKTGKESNIQPCTSQPRAKRRNDVVCLLHAKVLMEM